MPAAVHQTAYQPVDTETSLKFSIERLDSSGIRMQLIEGEFRPMSPTWDHENVVDKVRDRLAQRAAELKAIKGTGNMDLPGTENWYLPDIAIVPEALARGAKALSVSEALLVVEVTSESNASDDRVKKLRRYGQYGVPLYLLVDRVDHTWTLYSDPAEGDTNTGGYHEADGPHPFGVPIRLPDPFDITISTDDL